MRRTENKIKKISSESSQMLLWIQMIILAVIMITFALTTEKWAWSSNNLWDFLCPLFDWVYFNDRDWCWINYCMHKCSCTNTAATWKLIHILTDWKLIASDNLWVLSGCMNRGVFLKGYLWVWGWSKRSVHILFQNESVYTAGFVQPHWMDLNYMFLFCINYPVFLLQNKDWSWVHVKIVWT